MSVPYAWKAYGAPASSGNIPVLVGSLIVTVSGFTFPASMTLSTMTPNGVLGGAVSTQGPGPRTPVIADANNIYVAYRDIFPRDWITYWSRSGYAETDNLNGTIFNPIGFVRTAGAGAVVTGSDRSPNYPSAANYTLPNTAITYQNYPAYTGSLGYAVFDGTWVWAALIGSAIIFKIDPTTLAETVYTLPAATNGSQAAFDGRYIYLNTNTDIVIWDTVGLSGVLAGVSLTAGGACYYSANLNEIFVADNGSAGGNVYTMPVGGGALTLIGNAGTVTADVNTMEVLGFCDGPRGNDVWASVTEAVAGSDTYNMVWRPANPNPLIMMV